MPVFLFGRYPECWIREWLNMDNYLQNILGAAGFILSSGHYAFDVVFINKQVYESFKIVILSSFDWTSARVLCGHSQIWAPFCWINVLTQANKRATRSSSTETMAALWILM